MKDFNITQGDWRSEWDARRDSKRGVVYIRNKQGEYVAEIDYKCEFNSVVLENVIPNARLIASAPELLNALQDLVRFCKENDVSAELEYAKDVINKSLGM